MALVGCDQPDRATPSNKSNMGRCSMALRAPDGVHRNNQARQLTKLPESLLYFQTYASIALTSEEIIKRIIVKEMFMVMAVLIKKRGSKAGRICWVIIECFTGLRRVMEDVMAA